jgi:tetratricopeptide (TPR) repeat protein
MDTGEYGGAQEVLEAAVGEDAGDPDLRYALGETLRRRGRTSDAIRMLETVRVQHPRAPRVLISLRELYRESGQWEQAAGLEDAYLQTLPVEVRGGERERLVQFRYQAAVALPGAAARLAALDAVVRSDRAFVPAQVSLGDALVEAGRIDEARKLWEKAFKASPRLVFVERLLASATSRRERERALALLGKHSDRVDPDGMHLLLASSALADDRLDAAERELAAVADQDAATVQRGWAELYHRRGDSTAAWTALSRAADRLGAAATDHCCTVCGRFSEAWVGYCEGCERWDTYRSGPEPADSPPS